MIRLGEAFGRALNEGAVFLLRGLLGAGKTQFVKGLALGLDIMSVVNSPTFTIVKPHQGRLALQHIDLYRLETEEQCEDLGIEDLVDTGTVVAIEWPERYDSLSADRTYEVEIGFGASGDERIVTIWGDEDAEEDIVKQLALQTGGAFA